MGRDVNVASERARLSFLMVRWNIVLLIARVVHLVEYIKRENVEFRLRQWR